MTFTTNFSKTAATLAFSVCMAMPAFAQIQKNAVGTIEATIDGEAYRGETLEVPSEETSTAGFTAIGPMTSVTIQAHDPDSDNLMHNVLNIELTMSGDELVGNMIPPSLSYWPAGMNAPFFNSEESGTEPSVTIDDVSFADGEAFIRGSFSARPCKQESFFAEIDTDDCITVEGTFDTVLLKSEL